MRRRSIIHNNKQTLKYKQHGSMVVMSLFIIVVVGLLAAALIKVISTSSDTTISQVHGLRAKNAAQAGIQQLLQASFPPGANPVACNSTTSSPPSFSTISGFGDCQYSASCTTQTITFGGVDRLYYKYSATGSCEINTTVVARTVSVDAVQELAP